MGRTAIGALKLISALFEALFGNHSAYLAIVSGYIFFTMVA
jgi:hypothetical protein